MVKANKDDVEGTKELIESLNERVKHLATLQVEVAGAMNPVKESIGVFDDETKKQMLSKIDNIQRQSKIVNTWINDTELCLPYNEILQNQSILRNKNRSTINYKSLNLMSNTNSGGEQNKLNHKMTINFHRLSPKAQCAEEFNLDGSTIS